MYSEEYRKLKNLAISLWLLSLVVCLVIGFSMNLLMFAQQNKVMIKTLDAKVEINKEWCGTLTYVTDRICERFLVLNVDEEIEEYEVDLVSAQK